MLKSMTGFGRGECIRHDRRFKIELKSVNHRFSDFTIKIPRFLNPFEDRIRHRLAKDIIRGKVDVWVNFESFTADDITIEINDAYADAYMTTLKLLSKRYGLGDVPVGLQFELLAKAPDVIVSNRYENVLNSEFAKEAVWEGISVALEQALKQYNTMRETEGSSIEKDIWEKHAAACALVSEIKNRVPRAAEEYATKLQDRICDLTSKLGGKSDDSRLLTEIALLADKTDINEEITRLDSHFTQMAEMLKDCGSMGRKMDFLVQELNREANTVGSKSVDVTLTKTVVELKSVIEKIREQVQNIE
ncbi:MAG: YicC family protein [Defluviitaleaceae bacterium]|nr:YicC family protein [Defluviitaleaceae bacterium]MCL2264218.1 YicC family protein [Defluviitaleaceae bacterium]